MKYMDIDSKIFDSKFRVLFENDNLEALLYLEPLGDTEDDVGCLVICNIESGYYKQQHSMSYVNLPVGQDPDDVLSFFTDKIKTVATELEYLQWYYHNASCYDDDDETQEAFTHNTNKIVPEDYR